MSERKQINSESDSIMDSISNSGVSLILNPDIANVINENEHQHDLSTCEEEFENQEEIQQMLVNAFDSHSLSNTDHDVHDFDDDEDEHEEEEKKLSRSKYFSWFFLKKMIWFIDLDFRSPVEDVKQSQEYLLLQQENENLRHRLSEYATNEEIYRKNAFEHEQQMNELHEKHEQKFFSLRLEYETKIEQITGKSSEQQIEMLTLKQMYETIRDEKYHVDEQLNDLRTNEQNLQEKLEKIQMDYEQLLKATKKPIMNHVLVQTVKNYCWISFALLRIF